MKKTLQYVMGAILSVIAAIFSPLTLFFSNIGSIKFYEVLTFCAIFSVIGLCFFFVFSLLMRSPHKASVTSTIVVLAFLNMGRLTSLISYKFAVLLFLLAVALITFAVWKFLKEDFLKMLVPALSVMLAVLLLVNTAVSIPGIIKVSKAEYITDVQHQYDYVNQYVSEAEPDTADNPNIYFIVLDEYAGFNSIKKFYEYDNAVMKDFLEEKNFSVSYNSTNYMDDTFECLANVFNLEVSKKNNFDVTSENYCKNKVERGVLFSLLENRGYNMYATATGKMVDLEDRTERFNDEWSKTKDSLTTIDIMIAPTLLSPFVDYIRAVLNNKPLGYYTGEASRNNRVDAMVDVLEYYTDEQSYVYDNAFTYCYEYLPHYPFFFDENGNRTEEHNIHNWADKEHYLGQYKYCTELTINAITGIIENDPDSIIILMSDHGVRNDIELDEKATWLNDIRPEDAADILCAVYYKGEDFGDIEGLCGSNVVISVLNKAFGYTIPLIDESQATYFE